jgi:hypothetical protein
MPKLAVIFLVPALGLCQRTQLAPVSLDPHELVTGGAQSITTLEQREPLLALAARAVNRSAMHAKGSPPHVLEMTFNATASTLFAGGTGQLRETWISGESWRLDASLGPYSLVRINSGGTAYDEQRPAPVPMRLKMLYNAVFAPIQGARLRGGKERLRSASVTWNGVPLSCILLSPGMTASPRSSARDWLEMEYCIDPATGLLNIYSEAPGIYVSYDYNDALQFHRKALPRKISIVENGVIVLEAQLTGIIDPPASNPDLTLEPTAKMIAQGPALRLMLPVRPWAYVNSTDVSAGSTIQPVIVHAIVDEKGAVQESEVLQTSALSAKALAYASNHLFDPLPPDGGPPRQREVFLEVQFRPKM